MKEELGREEYRLLEQIESYISNHSNVLFSHAICPECEVKVMPSLRA